MSSADATTTTPRKRASSITNASNGGHSHSHGSDADGIVAVLQGQGNRGALVTLLGLLTNIGLTVVKGFAGWYLNSAVLLADAGHSLSDLTGDLVTLFFYTLSRRPRSPSYPYGYGKFESLGTSTVAAFLLLGASAIGAHSYAQLEEAIPSLHAYLPWLSRLASIFADSDHHHSPSTSEPEAVDPNAAWVAVLSIVAKEGMYRISSRVAKAENSPVLLANALHHRSDMYSSFVSLVAILGNWFMPELPLDPVGGLLVTLLIIHQAYELLSDSFSELTDHSLDACTLDEIAMYIGDELASSPHSSSLVRIPTNVRGIRRGAHLFVEATVDVSGAKGLNLEEVVQLEDAIVRRVRGKKKEVRDVRIRWAPVEL